MRRVPFNPDALTGEQRDWWHAWSAKAAQATQDLRNAVSRGEDPDPEAGAAVWGDLKRWLLDNVFHDKCAYCEGTYGAHGPQDAEHWRPKKGVAAPVRDGKAQQVKRGDAPHPGYWWLAFSWENLIPGCKYCNSGRGKGTQFPIRGTYVFEPDAAPTLDDLDATEQPYLLHPWRGRDPADHIAFDKDGFAYSKDADDDYAYWTITVLDLNRDKLVTARKQRQRDAVDKYGLALLDKVRYGEQFSVADRMREWEGPAAPYSRAVQDTIAPIRKSVGQDH